MRTIPAEYIDVYLAGDLGKQFGRKFRLACKNARQAIKLIGLARPDFKAHMVKSAREGVRFHVIADRRSRTEQQIGIPVKQRLIISHEVAGAKGALGSILEVVAGVALVAAAVLQPELAPLVGSWYTAGVASAVGAVGMSLVLAGVTQLLSPQAPGSSASYYFNGATNDVQQGQPVPVIYGEMMVGGLPISSSLQAVDLSAAPGESGLITD